MKMKFYDVKTRQSVETEVTEKKEYESRGQVRYAVRGKTSDGRSLTRFVSKVEYDKLSV
jgi:acyl dehydratase